MAGNLADCMPTASCRLRPTPTRPSSEAPTSPARCSQARSHCFSLPCSFTCPSFPPRAACHDCWHLTTFISSSLEARSILCPQPVCKNLSRTRRHEKLRIFEAERQDPHQGGLAQMRDDSYLKRLI